MSSAASPDREPGPAARPSGSRAEPSTASADGIPLGRPPGSSGSGQGGPVSVASASGRETGATGAITRYARPQGGYQVRPGYPATARRLGIQGTTMLRVHVLVDGQVGDVVVQESAGHPDLDQAAADAVRRWRSSPGGAVRKPWPCGCSSPSSSGSSEVDMGNRKRCGRRRRDRRRRHGWRLRRARPRRAPVGARPASSCRPTRARRTRRTSRASPSP